ncbi:MAG TPA: phospholipase D-like domain-containing protein [Ignavibacteria bacterium]|nr:phospholipase D-like domain-containing protein [Ignavibacteria bacterium]
MNKFKLKILFLFLFPLIIFPQQKFDIELVESIPVETTLDNPDIRNTQEVWLEMINSAQKTLDIEQFYITSEEGEPLDTILKAIVAAANRGVEVRIIVDAGFYEMYPADVSRLDAQSYNIEKRVIDFKTLAGGIQHAKFFIVDDEQVFLGSQNYDWRSLKHIHELGVKIDDEFFSNDLLMIFNADWNYCETHEWNIKRSRIMLNCVYVNYLEGIWTQYWLLIHPKDYSILNYPDILHLREIFDNTHSEITLQFLSYNVDYKGEYWGEIEYGLIKAAERGVKIKLIISDWNLGKSAVEHFKYLITFPNIEIKYTEIPEWSGGYVSFARVEHCKFITADSVCWIGTSNMSKDYFYNSRNVGVVVENGKFTQRVRDIFYKSWNSNYAHKIEEEGTYKIREHGEIK